LINPPQSRFTEPERRHAVERAARLMSEDGYSQNRACAAIGDELGVTSRTVMRWAEDLDTPLGVMSRDTAKTAAATEALVEYAADRRRALSDLLFSRVEVMAQTANDSGVLKDLATTFGILTDKRRLEEGKATERTEAVDLRSAIDRGRDRLRSMQGGKGS
jgi:hypothetical protein